MHNFTPQQLAETIKRQLEAGHTLEQVKDQFKAAGGDDEAFMQSVAIVNLDNSRKQTRKSYKLILVFSILLLAGAGGYFLFSDSESIEAQNESSSVTDKLKPEEPKVIINPASDLIYEEKLTLEGWGEVKVGQTKNVVESLIGKAEKEEFITGDFVENYILASYFSRGLEINYSIDDEIVQDIEVYLNSYGISELGFKPFSAKIENSITSDSTQNDVINAFGDPVLSGEDIPNVKYPGVLFLYFPSNQLEKIIFRDVNKSKKSFETSTVISSNKALVFDVEDESINDISLGMDLSDIETVLGEIKDKYDVVATYESRRDTSFQFDPETLKIVAIKIVPWFFENGEQFRVDIPFKTSKGITFYSSDKDVLDTYGEPEKINSTVTNKEFKYGKTTFQFDDNGWLVGVYLGDHIFKF